MKNNKKLILPAIIAVMTYLFCYQVSKVFAAGRVINVLALPIDLKIPFYSLAIIVYIYSYFQWAQAILIAMKQEAEIGYKYASALMIGSLIGFVIFVVYPTAAIRPEIIGTGIFDSLCKMIYSVDSNINACPSFHCFCSTISIFVLRDSKNISKQTLYINMFISLLVYISTLLTKQHLLIDVPCGILLGIFSVFITNKINFNSLFIKINKIFKIN